MTEFAKTEARSAIGATGTKQEARSPQARPGRICRIARTWERTPYRHQASLKGVACDCLGLARGVWRELYAGGDPETVPASRPTGRRCRARRRCSKRRGGTWCRSPRTATRKRAGGGGAGRPARSCAGGRTCRPSTAPSSPRRATAATRTGWRIIHAYDAAKRVAEVPLAPQWRKMVVAAFRFPTPPPHPVPLPEGGGTMTDGHQEAGSAERATGRARRAWTAEGRTGKA